MKGLMVRFVREEEGQDIIEYALLAAFISIVAWGILVTIGTDVTSVYTNVNAATTDAAAKSGAAGS
jgi:pilus assembly protein Flp/PilA